MELRLEKEAMQKDKKKKKKGGDESDEDAIRYVKIVKYSNIDISSENLPPFSKWMGSILQTIVDRKIKDAYEPHDHVWKKIYPQEDGVPVFNPSGRYWVKLYHMGQLTKVEIDDKFPITYGNDLFPKSEDLYQIWPQIFSKAICKLYKYRWENNPNFHFNNLVGDGCIMYALTGLIPETLDIRRMSNNDWDKIHRLLNDEEYTKNQAYMVCYSNPGHTAHPPSNKLETEKDLLLAPNDIATSQIGVMMNSTSRNYRGQG